MLVLILLLFGPVPAYAYIDPSAGSLLLQLILGGLAGVLVALRLSWRRLTGMFRRGTGSAEERDPNR